MRIQVFQHVPFEGLGAIDRWLKGRGAEIEATHFYAGARPPAIESIDGLVVMGGPMSVNDDAVLPWLAEERAFVAAAVARGLPVLGVCLGAQMIARALGGRVFPNPQREIGWFPVTRAPGAAAHPLGACFPDRAEVFHWHGETFTLPPGGIHLLRSAACEHQAFAVGNRVLGMQFHLETTEESARLLAQNCADELTGGPYVQSAEAMLASSERFARLNSLMFEVLDAWWGPARLSSARP